MSNSNMINTNIRALTAHRSILNVNKMSTTAAERLASGVRINSAADDAAGLAISEKLRNQIAGSDQAARNSNDAISLVQTTEGALSEIHGILLRAKELTVQAANDTLTAEDRMHVHSELVQLFGEINSIARNTSFNGIPVLQGDPSTWGEYNQVPGWSDPDMGWSGFMAGFDFASDPLGSFSDVLMALGFGAATNSIFGNITNPFGDFAPMSLDELLTYIGTTDETGAAPLQESFKEFFADLSFPPGLYPRADWEDQLDAIKDVESLHNFINGPGFRELFDHENLQIEWPEEQGFLDFLKILQELNDMSDIVNEAADSFSVALREFLARVEEGRLTFPPGEHNKNVLTSWLESQEESLKGSGWELIRPVQLPYGLNSTEEVAAFIQSNDFNALFVFTGENAFADLLQMNNYIDIDLHAGIAVGFSGVGWPPGANFMTLGFQTGPNSMQRTNVRLYAMNLNNLGLGRGSDRSPLSQFPQETPPDPLPPGWVSAWPQPDELPSWLRDFELATQLPTPYAGIRLSELIHEVDQAAKRVSSQRALLGAVQNRMEHTINVLRSTSENLSAANSRIRDADMAKEMMNFSKANVLTQAGLSMLAQANMAPQTVMQLLQ